MSNRVIKDSICTSPTVNTRIKKLEHCLAFPWWLLLSDDWGCFDADVDVIKGKIFPKRKDVTPSKVLAMRTAYENAGILFVWSERGEREWGYFVSFDVHHNFCNKTSVDGGGKQVRHKRKTPAPPNDLLAEYLSKFQSGSEKVRAAQSGYRIPIPTPIPTPIPKPTPKPTPSDGGMDEFFEEDWKSYTRPGAKGNKQKAKKYYIQTVGKNLEENRPLFQAKIKQQIAAVSSLKFLPRADSFFQDWQGLEFNSNTTSKVPTAADYL